MNDEFEPLTQEQLAARNAFFLALPNADLQAKIIQAKRVIDSHNDIVVSVSGGADSDCMVDWLWHLDVQKKCRYLYSAAYTKYGMKRTGCAGCPYNSKWEQDIAMLEQYEPAMAQVCKKVFAPSYEYSRKFKAFKAEMNRKERLHGQMELEEFL